LKRIILDEGVPRQVARYLPGHDVTDVHEAGWNGMKNGRLLALIEKAGFEVFISNDKRIEFDQNWSRRPFAALLLSTNHWRTLKPNVGNIEVAVETAEPGQVTRVDVGHFLPSPRKRFRPPQLG
jgi:hypothetical protein